MVSLSGLYCDLGAENGCFWGVKTMLTRVVLCRRQYWSSRILGSFRKREVLISLGFLFWVI